LGRSPKPLFFMGTCIVHPQQSPTSYATVGQEGICSLRLEKTTVESLPEMPFHAFLSLREGCITSYKTHKDQHVHLHVINL
jgi:hypothetical protein